MTASVGAELLPDRVETPLRFFEVVCWGFVLCTPFTDLPIGILPLFALAAIMPFLLFQHREGMIVRQVVWFAVLATYCLASAVFSGMPASNLVEFSFYRRDAKFLLAYLPFVVAALIAPAHNVLMRMLRSLSLLAAGIAAAGIVEYAFAIVHLHLELLVHDFHGMLMFVGFGTSHNAAGSFYAVVAVLVYGQILADNWRGALWWAAFVALELGAVLTLSRAFILASGLVLFVATLLSGRKRLIWSMLLVSMCVLPLAGAGLAQRFVELKDPEEVTNVTTRFQYWARAIDYIERSPWIGIGFSRFNDIPAPQFEGTPGLVEWKSVATVQNDDDHAHNAVLMVWAETGVVGLILWTAFLGGIIRHGLQLGRSAAVPRDVAGLGWGVAMAFALVIVASAVAMNIVTPTAIWPAGVFGGAAMNFRPVRRAESTARAGA